MAANDEWRKLYAEAFRNKFSLDYVAKFEKLQQEHLGKDTYNEMKFHCKHVVLLIYRNNQQAEDAFRINLEMLRDTPNDHYGYWNVIGIATRDSAELNRTTEIRQFAMRYLKNKNDNIAKLEVFQWYIDHFANDEKYSEEVLVDLEPALAAVVLNMDIQIDNTSSFATRVHYLLKENRKAIKRLGNFHKKRENASEKQQLQNIERYMKRESIGWYRRNLFTGCQRPI
ncbi:hypothetical protein [Pedobacter duraquae]|uniref:Uncharacterized protein n=1 Tax=Pedobacter duraquae TaxID=425511 RepID=A0A4R6IEB5_9SPHI|nr:hypothetical protein [Pedobacter duraquae]TDO19967.1 hypothetical protein CLV32_3723 [Pedobacter duraquae]